MREPSRTALRTYAVIALLGLAIAVTGCASTPGPTSGGDGSGSDSGDGSISDPYWGLSENDGTLPMPERARGTEAIVTTVAGSTQIALAGASPAGWSVRMISSAGFADAADGTDTTLTVTLESPTHACTITPDTADANDYANLTIVFLEGEPAGSLSVITTCDGFDEPAEVDLGTQWYVSFAPPNE